MRKLSEPFMADLQEGGFLAPLREKVIADKDLDLQIRDDYLNIYYKGNSLLKLSRKGKQYHVALDTKFWEGLTPIATLDQATVLDFLKLIPAIKVNIARYGFSSLEVEYEQLIIRANNAEPRTNSEYFILDRQYSLNGCRFDLLGFYWRRQGRKREQEVPLCLMEIKFALNSDIQQIHSQLEGYYNLIKERGPLLAAEYEVILRQKLALGLFNQPQDRIEAMKTLRISPEIGNFKFVIILVDYNPYSKHFDPAKIKKLPFAKQIRIFHHGFAMWEINSDSSFMSPP